MTINALQSLQKHTRRGSIGIVIPPDKNFDQIKELILNSLVNHDKIHFVVGKIHFENWNPTQTYACFVSSSIQLYGLTVMYLF
ncbi:MAG: hypothetical protein EZS28_031217 [Streblomastix strix]|uniref:Uncharacterized protein n=1 Tax=Streblomastix strix TaxID=222440 RepID=A0A5J4US85_9EUKA|nr:MAG: hypothetical protein EZS28_031217 [Streblomastix strix]